MSPIVPTDPRRPLGALTVLLLASTLSVMAGAVLAPVLALIRDDLGLTDTAAGLVLTAHGLAIALASPLVGRAIDRWGARGSLAAGLLVYGVAGGAGVVLDSYPALIASRLVFGVGAAAVFTATTVAVFRLYSGAARDRAMGWRSSAISLGGLVWPLAGGALGALSWQAPFAVYLAGIPLAAAVLVALPASPRDAPPDPGAPAPGASDGIRPLLRASPVLLGYYALQGLAALLLYVMLVFVPLQLAESGAGSPLLAALCNCALSGVMALVGLAYARLRARANGDDGSLVGGALVAWTVAFAVAALASHPAGLLAAAALFGLGMGIAVPALTVLVAERAPTHLLGRATSLSATATFAAQPLAPLLFGPLVDGTSIPTGFLAAGATALITLATFPALRRWRRAPTLRGADP